LQDRRVKGRRERRTAKKRWSCGEGKKEKKTRRKREREGLPDGRLAILRMLAASGITDWNATEKEKGKLTFGVGRNRTS